MNRDMINARELEQLQNVLALSADLYEEVVLMSENMIRTLWRYRYLAVSTSSEGMLCGYRVLWCGASGSTTGLQGNVDEAARTMLLDCASRGLEAAAFSAMFPETANIARQSAHASILTQRTCLKEVTRPALESIVFAAVLADRGARGLLRDFGSVIVVRLNPVEDNLWLEKYVCDESLHRTLSVLYNGGHFTFLEHMLPDDEEGRSDDDMQEAAELSSSSMQGSAASLPHTAAAGGEEDADLHAALEFSLNFEDNDATLRRVMELSLAESRNPAPPPDMGAENDGPRDEHAPLSHNNSSSPCLPSYMRTVMMQDGQDGAVRRIERLAPRLPPAANEDMAGCAVTDGIDDPPADLNASPISEYVLATIFLFFFLSPPPPFLFYFRPRYAPPALLTPRPALQLQHQPGFEWLHRQQLR
jgi:hypothetical protein